MHSQLLENHTSNYTAYGICGVLSLVLIVVWWIYAPRLKIRRNSLIFWFLLALFGLLGPIIGGRFQ